MLVPAVAIILLFQLAGEVISRALHLPLPGPVLGMVGMVVALTSVPRLRLVSSPAQGAYPIKQLDMMPRPRVSVRNSPLYPIRPLVGISNSIRSNPRA